jgi:tetratricopeptide (TPR) repeat protein
MAYYGALGLAGNALRSGRLATAAAVIPEDIGHSFHRTAALDLRGHIHWQGGEHEKAAAYFAEALEQAKLAGAPVWVARTMRHLAVVCSAFEPTRALELIPEARELNESLDEHIGVAQCDVAAALAWAWKADWQRADAALRASMSQGLDRFAIGHPGMIEILMARMAGDDEAVQDAVHRVFVDRPADTGRPHVWLAVSALWAERPDLANFDDVEWYDSAAAARTRWLGLVSRLTAVWDATHPNARS